MKKLFQIVSLLYVGIAIAFIGSYRLHERISTVHSPDGKHIHQLYDNYPLTETFRASSQGLSGIGIATASIPNRETPELDVRVRSQNIEIPIQWKLSDNVIRISFKSQAQSKGQEFTVILDAPNKTKSEAIHIPYQSDSTKYPNAHVWQADVIKQGTLGLTEYERPTIAVTFARWLLLPHQHTVWLGIGLCVIGMSIQRLRTVTVIPDLPACRTGRIGGRNDKIGYYIAIFVSIVIVYWPATTLFFYSDDVPILARTEVLKNTNPLLLFTPYQYQETDPHANFGFDFWRPVSFVAYPLALSLLPGTPNANVYYACNLIIFVITGCLIFWIANYMLHSGPASLFVTALWAFHNTKLGLVYWWSSSQDILASLFAMAAIVLYLKKRPAFAIACYIAGMLSKEYVIVTPIVIAGIDLLSRQNIRSIATRMSGFLIAAGIFLMANTTMLGIFNDLEHQQANTYTLTLEPRALLRNIVVYASATAESHLWPESALTNWAEEQFSPTLELWRAKTSGPYYPGVLLVLAIVGITAAVWHKQKLRNLLLFGILWWTAYLGPILLFANDWKPRWLTLSLAGIAMIIAALLQTLRVPKATFIVGSTILTIYGFTIARDPNITRFYREQSAYTRHAYNQLQEQEQRTQDIKRIIIHGIIPDQVTMLNAYLFRVHAKNPNADIVYTDSMPTDVLPTDIIINMSGVAPYYPEREK